MEEKLLHSRVIKSHSTSRCTKRGKNPKTIFECDSVTVSERGGPGDLTKGEGEVGGSILQTKSAFKGNLRHSLSIRLKSLCG